MDILGYAFLHLIHMYSLSVISDRYLPSVNVEYNYTPLFHYASTKLLMDLPPILSLQNIKVHEILRISEYSGENRIKLREFMCIFSQIAISFDAIGRNGHYLIKTNNTIIINKKYIFLL